jgi:hypothetical protein
MILKLVLELKISKKSTQNRQIQSDQVNKEKQAMRICATSSSDGWNAGYEGSRNSLSIIAC